MLDSVRLTDRYTDEWMDGWMDGQMDGLCCFAFAALFWGFCFCLNLALGKVLGGLTTNIKLNKTSMMLLLLLLLGAMRIFEPEL